jgi:hypothetical protein
MSGESIILGKHDIITSPDGFFKDPAALYYNSVSAA